MRVIIILMLTTAFFLSGKASTKNEQIRIAVENQLRMYPKSTLQDLYKNFFQDYFGPGHIVSDTASAGAYLDRELASFEQVAGDYYEPTGYNTNFYRVNLSVIKEGLISRDAFFDAFIRSVSNIQTISIDVWKEEWKQIDSVIRTMNLSLANYEQDRENLFSLLEQDKYVVHHSEPFSEAHDPHYRIIGREVFLNEILPNLPSESSVDNRPRLHDFTVTDINNKPYDQSLLKGKKVLIVNAASKCGLTPDYTKLQELYEKYQDEKIVIVGFPCNDFGALEPGSHEEIVEFCQMNYGVTFLLMSKVFVKGEGKAPLYKWLTEKSENGKMDAEIKWNFQKFMINEDGQIVEYIPPQEEFYDKIAAWIEDNN